MPDKIAKRSRRVGSQKPSDTTKRGRPPKTESAPLKPSQDDLIPETILDAPQSLIGGSQTTLQPRQPIRIAESYTGLTGIEHGLTFTEFTPNSYFAGDLFSNSSTLQETEKSVADETVGSIEKKRQTLRIVGANIALNTDVVRTANDFRKFEGAVIDYATTGVNNETKFVNYQTAGVNKDIALNRFDQSNERLTQGQKVLAGMQSITPLIDTEWAERKSLKSSQIKSLQLAAIQAKDELQPKLMQLSQDFKQELNEVA